MIEENYKLFGYFPFEISSRPRGAHLFRVYSMANRCKFEFYYRVQLIEWTRLEFDPHVAEFCPVNQYFKSSEAKLFVAFRACYMTRDCFLYVAKPSCEATIKEFEAYCSVAGVACKQIGGELVDSVKFEVWNRLKILSMIARWREELTENNVRHFLLSLKGYSSCAIGDIEKLEGYEGGRGVAYALELVRVGKFQLDEMQKRMISGKTIISFLPSGGRYE